MGSERFPRSSRRGCGLHAPGTLTDLGVRVPNPAPDDPGADPAVRFDRTGATVEEREFVNRSLGTPGELTVTPTSADGSEQQRTLDDPSFPATVGGTGDHDGETTEALRATDRAGRSVRVPNSSVGDCDRSRTPVTARSGAARPMVPASSAGTLAVGSSRSATD